MPVTTTARAGLNEPSVKSSNVDAAYVTQLLAELEQNKKLIKEMKIRQERKNRIIQDLAMDLFCLAHLKPSQLKKRQAA